MDNEKVCKADPGVYESLLYRLENVAEVCEHKAAALSARLFGSDTPDVDEASPKSSVLSDRLERVIGCLERTAKSMEDTGCKIGDKLGDSTL